MRFASVCLVALLLVATSDAAVLMRFLNLVPQRFFYTPFSNAASAVSTRTYGYQAAGNTWNHDIRIDRVGLQYYPTGQSRQIVWTEMASDMDSEITVTGAVAPYAWTFAMPPLRQYHGLGTSAAGPVNAATVDTDRVAAYTASQYNDGGSPSQYDLLEQTALKEDGVCGYISFAAGTYQMSAYGVLGATTAGAVANVLPRFDFSTTSLTFQDGLVYTVVATGNAAFTASPSGTGNNVQLTAIVESTDSTTFGMASIRFFHGIQSFQASGDSINIANPTAQLFSGIAFGTVSPYMDVKPNKNVHFSVARSSTPTKDETDVTQVTDIRVGLRATLYCGINNLQSPSVFCRMIPSRVIAYVRLVHDAAATTQLIQGAFGPQQLGQTNLNLWAAIESIRPEQAVAWSQDIGEVVTTGHPLTTRGLYPVVVNVQPNTVSGYGEVHVPLFIMDFACRYQTGYIPLPYTTSGSAMNNPANRRSGTVANIWFDYAPMFKRVGFVVKTDGYATVEGDNLSTSTGLVAPPARGVVFGGETEGTGATAQTFHQGYFSVGTNNLQYALLSDLYLEPGEFYSIFVTTQLRTAQLAKLQSSAMVKFVIRRDLSVDDVHTDLNSPTGSVMFIPFGKNLGTGLASQTWASINVAMTGSTGSSQPRVFSNIGVSVNNGDIFQVFGASGWPASQSALQLASGSYTYATSTAGTTCDTTLPAGSLTIVAAQRIDVFVLNTEGCFNNGGVGTLVSIQTPQQSAAASNNSPFVTAGSRRAAADRHAVSLTTYNAASSTAPMSVLFTAVVAMLALLFC